MPETKIFRILPAEGARLTIVDDQGEIIMGDRDFPTQEVALAELQDMAKSHGMGMTVHYLPNGRLDRISMGEPSRTVQIAFSLPAEMADRLILIAATQGVL